MTVITAASAAVGGPTVDGVLTTDDGVLIRATYYSSDARATAGDGDSVAFVVGHGFTGSRLKDDNVRVIECLRQYAPVVALDFRGHGTSEGASTLGHREVLDLDAAIGWARSLGHERIASIGFSMGSSIAVRQAALCSTVDRDAAALTTRHAPNAVVAISGTAFWFYRGTPPMRLLHRAVSTAVGRGLIARASGTRVDVSDWERDVLPYSPEECAAMLAPIPLLVVHGEADHYFPLEHAYAMHSSARDGAERRGVEPAVDLWVEPGFAHAEAAVTPEILRRVSQWASAAVAP